MQRYECNALKWNMDEEKSPRICCCWEKFCWLSGWNTTTICRRRRSIEIQMQTMMVGASLLVVVVGCRLSDRMYKECRFQKTRWTSANAPTSSVSCMRVNAKRCACVRLSRVSCQIFWYGFCLGTLDILFAVHRAFMTTSSWSHNGVWRI